MRDRPDHVDAEADRPPHQLLAAFEGVDALLREGDQLEAHLLAQLGPGLEETADRGQLGVADVDVAAHVLDAVGELPAEHRQRPPLDVLDRQ